jgi:hypothetical protein
MLTICCSPKPFVAEAAWNQINALRSWRAIHPNTEIVMFGAPYGASEAAAEVNAKLVPEVVASPSGAPSFNAMVAYADRHGQHDLIVYANCDILLNATLVQAMLLCREHYSRFLLVGERMDLAESVVIDIRYQGWIHTLSELAANSKLTVHGPTGADYFGFVRGMWTALPSVFMGRAMCDQALLHYCLRHHIPIIDGTLAVVNVHQYHDYRHVAGGRQQIFFGEERRYMAQAHGLHNSLPTITDANCRFISRRVISQSDLRRTHLRNAELCARYSLGAGMLAAVLRGLQYWRGRRKLVPKLLNRNDILREWNSSAG